MSYCARFRSFGVRALTLSALSVLASCAHIWSSDGGHCKSRAYLASTFQDYLGERYRTRTPIRLGVMPYSVPANLAARSNELPGLGNQLAWKVKNELMSAGEITIVELLNRQDWPGKKEEFFSGNFGALDMAREVGYDLILVGYVENLADLHSIRAHTKIIEVDTGITVFNTRTEAWNTPDTLPPRLLHFTRSSYKPALLQVNDLVEELSVCIADQVLVNRVEEELPEEAWIPGIF